MAFVLRSLLNSNGVAMLRQALTPVNKKMEAINREREDRMREWWLRETPISDFRPFKHVEALLPSSAHSN
jgi:hypothetical protein